MEGRGSLKTECYFIHDRNFVNVVTYRVLKMQQDIAKREQNKVSAVAYVCVGCSPPKQARCVLGRFTCITHTRTHRVRSTVLRRPSVSGDGHSGSGDAYQVLLPWLRAGAEASQCHQVWQSCGEALG